MSKKKASRPPASRRRPARRSSGAESQPGAPRPDAKISVLLHELQVYSEALTVRNEQLLTAQAEFEEARDRYADLFEFSPVGYVTLDAGAVILEINIAATALFGRRRSLLRGLPLIDLIVPESRERFRTFLTEANDPANAQAMVEVELARRPVCVRLIARHVRSRPDAHELFTALVDITAQRQLEQARQITMERLVKVQEEERRRLARNLHDQLGQQLTALRLALTMAREGQHPGARSQGFELMDQIVSQLDRDVDSLAWELRPAALDDVGLEPAIKEFLRQWSAANGVVADLHAGARNHARLHPDIESNLYRIVQEALNNVSKHARARHVSVLLDRKDNAVTLIVEDDGCGFDAAGELMLRGQGGMGLMGIRERTALVGGGVDLESTPGKGTTLFVRIPLRAGAATESA